MPDMRSAYRKLRDRVQSAIEKSASKHGRLVYISSKDEDKLVDLKDILFKRAHYDYLGYDSIVYSGKYRGRLWRVTLLDSRE